MLRWLSVVFTTGVVLTRPCAAADAGESVVRLFSQEMRQIEANSVELQSQLSSLPPAPVPQWAAVTATSAPPSASWARRASGSDHSLRTSERRRGLITAPAFF